MSFRWPNEQPDISLAVVGDKEHFVRTALCRTVANTLSMGFVARKWSQWSAGKS
jgi:hypothetical protein